MLAAARVNQRASGHASSCDSDNASAAKRVELLSTTAREWYLKAHDLHITHNRLASSMSPVARIALAALALLHVYILVLEMFLWTQPAGRKAFNLSAEFAQASKGLAANQGLYNGFLAAGLGWAAIPNPHDRAAALFFLGCVLVAGLYGAATASRKILFVQAVPATIGLGLVLWS